MRLGLKYVRTLAATITAVLLVATPAAAAPVRHEFGWIVTESAGGTPLPPNAPPQTNSNPPRDNHPSNLLATPADDLKQTCRNQHAQAASSKEGWMADRFNRCWIGHRKVELRCLDCSTVIASVEFDYTLVGIAQNGIRQVDFSLTFDNWVALGGQERETTPLRVSLSGCGSLVSCNPTLGEFTQPLGSWRTVPYWQATMTSANDTGIGPEYLATAMVNMSMAITPLNNVAPWSESNMTSGQVRFDSAGAAAGKYHGTVFSDFTPTYDLVALARADSNEYGVKESIQHIDDALHHVSRTFPSFVGKSPPGEYKASLGANQRPLHRLRDSVAIGKNRDYAGKVCDDVWGDGAATPNLNCDEYPMASTKEGAYTGSSASTGNPDGWRTWNGSARLIGEVDNQDSGRQYLNIGFYQPNRILDNDAFFVAINR